MGFVVGLLIIAYGFAVMACLILDDTSPHGPEAEDKYSVSLLKRALLLKTIRGL
jgi:hypothetical protein